MTGVFGGTLAGVECKGKGGWEVGLGIERRVDGAHREIEKVQGWGCQGKVERTDQASRPEEGGILSAGGQGEHRAERLTGRSEFGRSLC